MTSFTGPINLSAMFMLALEIKFEKGLYLHNEGYDDNINYDLLQSLKKLTCICTVLSVAKTSFDPIGHQGSTILTFLPTPKGRPVELPLHLVVCRYLNLMTHPHMQWILTMMYKRTSPSHPWMTQYGLRNLYQRCMHSHY